MHVFYDCSKLHKPSIDQFDIMYTKTAWDDLPNYQVVPSGGLIFLLVIYNLFILPLCISYNYHSILLSCFFRSTSNVFVLLFCYSVLSKHNKSMCFVKKEVPCMIPPLVTRWIFYDFIFDHQLGYA